MPPSLPGELTDRIISFVLDYRTLLSCALVCHEWLPAGRAALFDRVRLDRKSAFDSFVKHVLNSERMYPYLHATRAMWIHERLAYEGLRRTGQQWSYRFIHEFAGHFPNLEHLKIWYVDWSSPTQPHPSVYAAVRCFTSLRKLDLHWCQLPSWHSLRRLVTALSSSLTVLRLLNVTCSASRGVAPTFVYPAASALLELEYISLPSAGSQGLIPFLCWLSHTPTCNSLRRLVFSEFDLTAEYTEFLTRVVPVLTELSINIPLTSPRRFPFHELRSLRALEVRIWFRGSYWKVLSRLLPEVPSRLHSIALCVYAQEITPPEVASEDLLLDPRPMETDGLELLDPVLQGDNFQDLQRMEFNLHWVDRSSKADIQARAHEVVPRRLPSLTSRSIDIAIGVDIDQASVSSYAAPFTLRSRSPHKRHSRRQNDTSGFRAGDSGRLHHEGSPFASM